MMKKQGRRMRRPQDRGGAAQSSSFMKRDGTVVGEPDGGDSVGQLAKDSVKRLSVSGGTVLISQATSNGFLFSIPIIVLSHILGESAIMIIICCLLLHCLSSAEIV